MKNTKLVLTFLSVAALALGCKPSAEQAGTDPLKATAKPIDTIATETKEIAQDMKDYAYAQKSEFIAKMQNQLLEIDKDLNQLAAKIEKSTDAAKAEAKPKLDELRRQVAKLNQQLDEVKNVTESKWNDVHTSFKKGYGELKDGFQQARQWVSDKIAP